MHGWQVAAFNPGEQMHPPQLLRILRQVRGGERELLLQPEQCGFFLAGYARIGGGVPEHASIHGECDHAHFFRRKFTVLTNRIEFIGFFVSQNAIGKGVLEMTLILFTRTHAPAAHEERHEHNDENSQNKRGGKRIDTHAHMLPAEAPVRQGFAGAARPARTFLGPAISSIQPEVIMRIFVAATAFFCAAVPVAAQQGHAGHAGHGAEVRGSGKLPAGWNARIDNRAANAELERLNLMQMGGALHAQMGAANAIFWTSNHEGKGDFEASATFRQTKANANHPEGYGLVFNGSNLDGPAQSYMYFLVKDGQYLINHRAGTEVHRIVPWTTHAAIAKPDAAGQSTNRIAVKAVGNEVQYIVNDQVVHRHDRNTVKTDGVVGLRVNMHLDMLIENFQIRAAR